MRIYAFEHIPDKNTTGIKMVLNKEEFTRLQYKYNSFALLSNLTAAERDYKISKKNVFLGKVYKTLCTMLKDNEYLKYFKDDETPVKFTLCKTTKDTALTFRKEFLPIFKVFVNNVNVNDIVFGENSCYLDAEII